MSKISNTILITFSSKLQLLKFWIWSRQKISRIESKLLSTFRKTSYEKFIDKLLNNIINWLNLL